MVLFIKAVAFFLVTAIIVKGLQTVVASLVNTYISRSVQVLRILLLNSSEPASCLMLTSEPDLMLCQLNEGRYSLVMLAQCQLLISIGQNRRSGSECLGFYSCGIGIYEVVLESVRLFISSHMSQDCWLIV